MDKICNGIESVFDWLCAPNKVPFLVDDLSNAGAIFLGFVVVSVVAVCCSKKLRNIFF